MNRDFVVPVRGSFDAFAIRLSAAVLAVLLVCASGVGEPAWAMGVGRPLTQSSLGQPLNLVFPVRLNADEALTPECVRAEVIAGEAAVPANLVQLLLEGDGDTSIRAVRLRSAVQIDEPIVTVSLSLGCPARFTRQYTAFIDPPNARAPVPLLDSPPSVDAVARNLSPALRAALATAQAKPAALLSPAAAALLPGAVPVREASLPNPAPASTPKARRARPKVEAAVSAEPGVALSAASATARPARKPVKDGKLAKTVKAVPDRQVATAAPKAGPRLRMDAPEALESAALTASAPSPDEVAQPQMLLTLAQLEALGQSLTRVQQVQRETEARLLAMRAQLEQAQAERAQQERWRLILQAGLLLAILALAGGCVYLWLSRRRERVEGAQRWWSESRLLQGQQAALERADIDTAAGPAAPQAARVQPAAPQSSGPTPGLAPLFNAPPVGSHPDEITMRLPRLDDGDALLLAQSPESSAAEDFFDTRPAGGADGVLPPALAPALTPMAFSFKEVPDRHVTVEELIDLEQQVDFFQVLGQDEAAIELLEARIDSGGANALPYLKLLELHQRRGEQASFTEVAERFAARFGTLPPTWGANLNQGSDLEAYAPVMQRLVAGWGDSADSMALLQNLLSRGDAGPGESGRGFDLPAYRDLLMLYAVARDRSEHEVRSDEIDLFLPLDDTSDEGAALMATMVWQVQPTLVARSAEVDISLDDGEDLGAPPKR